MVKDNESRIELSIKNKGYEDVLCRLDSNKATVTVKSPNGLQESETVAIQEIVQDVSKIKDVIIEVQK
jgi:stage III sporulation protein AH